MLSSISPETNYKDRNTYSGFAFSTTHPSSPTFYITKDSEYMKERSSLLYERDPTNSLRKDALLIKGFKAISFGVAAYEKHIQGPPNVIFIEEIRQRLDNPSNSVEGPSLLQILTDYLQHLKSMAISACIRQYGASFDQSLCQWVLNVKQSWRHDSKSILRQACFESGIVDVASSDTLILYADGEAVVTKCGEPGDFITLCDCSGRMATISTYKVLPGGNNEQVGKESVIKNGSECINDILLDKFRKSVGEEKFRGWITESPQLIPRILKQFKNLKHFFSGREVKIESRQIRIQNEQVVLYHMSDVREIIMALVSELTNGISTHLLQHKVPKMSLMLVGGFSKSQVFIKAVAERFSLLTCQIPKEPSKAILDGMIRLAKEPNGIQSRMSRFSYGTQFSKKFDPLVDDLTAYRWGTAPTQFIASFLPFTQAGKAIPKDRVFEQIVCPANDHQTEFPFGLYYSQETSPNLKACTELITLTVGIPEAFRHLGRENRFRILMSFGITEIKFSVIHTQSDESHESTVVL